MLVKAAVVNEKNGHFSIQEVVLDEPKQGEVLVRIVASGICHTDLIARDQVYPVPLPAVLGHEGSGVVEKVGPGVTAVEPGDHVVLTINNCGKCKNCYSGKTYACENLFKLNFTGKMGDGTHRIHHSNGKDLTSFFGQSSFANYSIATERNVVKVDKDVPLELLGPLGCGIQTGAGAVLNKLKPPIGSTIAIFGCGSVGISALLAAKAIGCTTIAAVDLFDSRLELAKELGATHTINAKNENSVEKIMEITGAGIDFTVDTTGSPAVLRQATDCLAWLGTAAVVGAPPFGSEAKIDLNLLMHERTVTGVVEGSGVPQVFIPQLIRLYKQGQFPFDKLIKVYSFNDINQAVSDSESGATVKPVIMM